MITAQDSEQLLEAMRENAVCTFFGQPMFSLTLCETVRISTIILIVVCAIIIGVLVGLYLFRNEIRDAFKRRTGKTPN